MIKGICLLFSGANLIIRNLFMLPLVLACTVFGFIFWDERWMNALLAFEEKIDAKMLRY